MAGLNVIERTIGDSRYRVRQLGFGDARPLIWLGASVVLPAIEALGGVRVVNERGAVAMSALATLDISVIGKAARVFFDRARAEDFDRVVDIFSRQTEVMPSGSSKWIPLTDVAEVHWPSRYASLLAWFAFSIEVHFGPFSFAPATGTDTDGGPQAK